jgi:hypothetical protein
MKVGVGRRIILKRISHEEFEAVVRIHPVHDRLQWRAFVNMMTNLQVP